MLRGRSRALFHLLLLPPALDRPCNLLVLLSHLGEATLPGDVLEGTQSRASVSLHQLIPLSSTLKRRSGSCTRCVTAGCVRLSSSAAAVKLPRSTTSTKALS